MRVRVLLDVSQQDVISPRRNSVFSSGLRECLWRGATVHPRGRDKVVLDSMHPTRDTSPGRQQVSTAGARGDPRRPQGGALRGVRVGRRPWGPSTWRYAASVKTPSAGPELSNWLTAVGQHAQLRGLSQRAVVLPHLRIVDSHFGGGGAKCSDGATFLCQITTTLRSI
jgi:hypothetical protein